VAAEANDAVRILKDLRQSGLNQAVVGGDGLNSSIITEEAGTAANNVYLGSPWSASDKLSSSQAFVAAFHKAYGTNPDSFAAQAYGGMQVLRDAVRKGGTTKSDIQVGLGLLRTVKTVLGPFSFDISRDAVAPVVVNRIQNDIVTKIASAPPSA